MRDHEPIIIDKFNGLWNRGENEVVPQDHFTDCNNIDFIEGGIKTRDGLDTYRGAANVVRIYNYTTQDGPTLLFLTGNGEIYHSISPSVTHGPILTIEEMTDFGFVAFAGRAYITPCNGITGLEDEFVYVYKGDGTVARKAAGGGPISAPTVTDSGSGNIEAGYHVFGVAFETDTGFITKVSPLTAVNFTGDNKASVPLELGPIG